MGGFCGAFGRGKAMFWCSSKSLEAKAMFWCSSKSLEAKAACERVSRKSRDF
jgi:hypothetical protein